MNRILTAAVILLGAIGLGYVVRWSLRDDEATRRLWYLG